MNYRMAFFWGGILVLDYFLLMGLPTHPAQKVGAEQARLEPAHCWQAVYDGRQFVLANDFYLRGEACRLGSVSSSNAEKVSANSASGASGGRLKVNLSVRPVI